MTDFIAYDLKRGARYAKVCHPIKTKDGKWDKSYTYLGRVLDEAKGIYMNRERGIFTFCLETGEYGTVAPEDEPKKPVRRNAREKLILDFGDTFFLDAYIRKTGLDKAISAISYGNPDTLWAMLMFYLLSPMNNNHAADWYEGNVARIFYPGANLSSQRVSDFLAAVGDENLWRGFFSEYFKILRGSFSGQARPEQILIDSTGLPNGIHFPLTAISSHNGELSNEVRLIYVVQQKTGLPVYMRYVPGNVIDASTVVRTLAELKAQEINTRFAILDAGYYVAENVDEFFANKVSFLSRLQENRKLYRQLVKEHASSLDAGENLVRYNNRFVMMKCVKCKVDGVKASYDAYAYIAVDISGLHDEIAKIFRRAAADNTDTGEVYDDMQNRGLFVIISSRRISKEHLLPLYYSRQQIEQVFDLGKNNASMLPLCVRSEETFRGHLLMTFIAAVISRKLQILFKDSKHTISGALLNLRNQKCKIFDDKIITTEAFKKANEIYKLAQVTCPATFNHNSWLEKQGGN